MLSFYALLFFLLCTYAVAAPIVGHDVADEPHGVDGYWVLKKPNKKNHFSGTVLKSEHEKLSIFKLDKDFKIIPESKHVVEEHEKQFLLGVWHRVPVRSSPEVDRYVELTIELHPGGNTINLPDLVGTEASSMGMLPDPSGTHVLSKESLHVANGYWVLGDATGEVRVKTWREILHVEGGKYSTFELDDEFNIINRKNVDKPSPGDYFRIPSEGAKDRFVVLRARKNREGGIFINVQHLSE